MNRTPPRLPGLPFGPNAIAPAYVPPPPGVAGGNAAPPDTEIVQTQAIPWPERAFVSVGASVRRWRACDVYVTLASNQAIAARLSFIVYAVTGTSRTVVASGRLGPGFNYSTPGNTGPGGAFLVASARAQAQRFEVVAFGWGSSASRRPNFDVTLVCSDEANEPPPWVGQVTAFVNPEDAVSGWIGIGGGAFLDAGGAEVLLPLPEVRGFSAVNYGSAAPLYLLMGVYPRPPGTLVPPPTYAWPIGTTGQGLSGDFNFRMKGETDPSAALLFGISTSPVNMVAPAAGVANFNLIVR